MVTKSYPSYVVASSLNCYTGVGEGSPAMNALPADSIILVADDDDDDFLLLQKAFQWVDIEVEVRRAHDGVQLLEMLRRHGLADRVLLILMDLNMPRKDGRESIRELKSDPRLRAIPIVVLTNSHDEG